jgi:hypothetical protein
MVERLEARWGLQRHRSLNEAAVCRHERRQFVMVDINRVLSHIVRVRVGESGNDLRRGEAVVLDLDAACEREFAEMMRGTEELEEAKGREAVAVDEVDFEKERAVEGEEDDREIGEVLEVAELDLRSCQKSASLVPPL